jgi:hypothetical protein
VRTGCWENILDLRYTKLTEDCKRPHNRKLHNLYSSPNISVINLVIRRARHVASMRDMRNASKILVAKP